MLALAARVRVWESTRLDPTGVAGPKRLDQTWSVTTRRNMLLAPLRPASPDCPNRVPVKAVVVHMGNGKLVYAGFCGTDLSENTRAVIFEELTATRRTTCPFPTVPVRDRCMATLSLI